MDGVLDDFQSGIDKLDLETKIEFEGRYDDVEGIFGLMEPVDDAIDSFHQLGELFEVYILSTAPWNNPTAWSDKLLWVKKYLGDTAKKRLILSHHKDLNKGHFLIDDQIENGAADFEGELIRFRSEQFPDWKTVINYLINKA